MPDLKGAGGVIFTDSLDIANQSKDQKPVNKTYWREILAMVLVFLFVFCILVLLHNYAFYLLTSYEQSHVILGWIVIIAMYGSITAALVGSTVLGLAHLYSSVKRKNLVNLLEYQANIKSMENGTFAVQYFDMMNRRMDRSVFAGVQNLTYSPSNTRNDTAQQTVAEETIEEEIQEQLPLLQDMHQQGLIARSGNSVLLGSVIE